MKSGSLLDFENFRKVRYRSQVNTDFKNMRSAIVVFLVMLYMWHIWNIGVVLPRGTKYVFFTGGFDSTFLYCKSVMSRVPTAGIYLMFDEVDGTDNHRRSAKYELAAINNIVKELHRMGYGDYALPIDVIGEFELSSETKKTFRILHEKGYASRPITQYAYMAEYSLKSGKVIDCGCLGASDSPLSKLLKGRLNDKKMIIRPTKYLKPLRNMMFSLCGLGKREMLLHAKMHGFAHILRMTHSCWNPINGKPCGVCSMCRHRILKSNSLFDFGF